MIGVDFDIIIQANTPPHMRRIIRLEWMKVLSSGIYNVYAQLMNYIDSSNYKLAFRGQTIYLERLLNERYNNGASGIEIVNLNPASLIYIGNSGSGSPDKYVSNIGGANELMLGDNAYYNSLSDFEIQIPAVLFPSINTNEMRMIMKEYIFSGLKYEIVSK